MTCAAPMLLLDAAALNLLLGVLFPIAGGWTLVLFLLTRLHRMTPKVPVAGRIEYQSEMISVIVPARNEQANIARNLDSLLAQDQPNLEIIVVDDSSTDATAQIARGYAESDRRITVISAGPPPPSWAGKTWTCHVGSGAARGGWLLFTDADTKHGRQSLSSSYAYASSLGLDLLSLVPLIELKGWAAKAVTPILGFIIMILYPIRSVNDPKSKLAYTFGSFTLIRRDAYRRIGGFEAVKGHIVEDRALGEVAKNAGIKIHIARGEHLVSSLWAEGLADIWRGLERVVSSSVAGKPAGGIAFAALSFAMWLLPLTVTLAILSLIGGGAPFDPGLYAILGLSFYSYAAFIASQGLHILRGYHAGKANLIFAPLGAVIFIGALLSTAYKTSTGRPLIWKDRAYRNLVPNSKGQQSRRERLSPDR